MKNGCVEKGFGIFLFKKLINKLLQENKFPVIAYVPIDKKASLIACIMTGNRYKIDENIIQYRYKERIINLQKITIFSDAKVNSKKSISKILREIR